MFCLSISPSLDFTNGVREYRRLPAWLRVVASEQRWQSALPTHVGKLSS